MFEPNRPPFGVGLRAGIRNLRAVDVLRFVLTGIALAVAPAAGGLMIGLLLHGVLR